MPQVYLSLVGFRISFRLKAFDFLFGLNLALMPLGLSDHFTIFFFFRIRVLFFGYPYWCAFFCLSGPPEELPRRCRKVPFKLSGLDWCRGGSTSVSTVDALPLLNVSDIVLSFLCGASLVPLLLLFRLRYFRVFFFCRA